MPSDAPASPTESANEPSFDGIELSRYAALCARLKEASARRDVLGPAGIDDARWDMVDAFFTQLLARDATADGSIGRRYAKAFGAEQDRLGDPITMTIEEWAELLAQLSREGLSTLSSRGLTEPDVQRLSRHFGAQMATDKRAAKAYHEAFFRAQATLPKTAAPKPAAQEI